MTTLDEQLARLEQAQEAYVAAVKEHRDALLAARHDFEKVLMEVGDWAERVYGCKRDDVLEWPSFHLDAPRPLDLCEQLLDAAHRAEAEPGEEKEGAEPAPVPERERWDALRVLGMTFAASASHHASCPAYDGGDCNGGCRR